MRNRAGAQPESAAYAPGARSQRSIERVDRLLRGVHAECEFVDLRGAERVYQRGYGSRRADLVFERQLRPTRTRQHEVEFALISFVIVNASPVELRPWADVPVDPQDRVPPRL